MFEPKQIEGFTVCIFVEVGPRGLPDAEQAREEAQRIACLIRSLVGPQATFHRTIDIEEQRAP